MRLHLARRFPDVLALLAILVALNLHLLGVPIDHRGLVLAPSAVQAGRWWTPITHAFVHVSAYHLLLDAGALFLLYPILSNRPGRRLLALAACIAGSGLGAMLMRNINVYGFCGLSGAGHGLMAILALQMIGAKSPTERNAGRMVAVALLFKSIVEAFTGQVFFAAMHMGAVGVPNTFSHLAGTLAGLLYYRANGRESVVQPAHAKAASRQEATTGKTAAECTECCTTPA